MMWNPLKPMHNISSSWVSPWSCYSQIKICISINIELTLTIWITHTLNLLPAVTFQFLSISVALLVGFLLFRSSDLSPCLPLSLSHCLFSPSFFSGLHPSLYFSCLFSRSVCLCRSSAPPIHRHKLSLCHSLPFIPSRWCPPVSQFTALWVCTLAPGCLEHPHSDNTDMLMLSGCDMYHRHLSLTREPTFADITAEPAPQLRLMGVLFVLQTFSQQTSRNEPWSCLTNKHADGPW